MSKLVLLSRSIADVYNTSLKFKIGFSILMAMVIFSTLSVLSAPFLAPSNYRSWYAFKKDLQPSFESISLSLGTTSNGRSVFWILMHGILNSLMIGLITAVIASHVGLFIGMVAGIKGGWFDRALMLLTDTFIVIPGLPLMIVLAMSLKDYLTIPLIGLIISVVAWTWPARQVRAIVLSLREKTFVYVSRLSGMSSARTILFEIFPYLVSWHLINFTNTVLFSVATEAGLAILGLSILSEDTLGTMIYWATNYNALYRGIYWWIAPPIITLIMIFVALYLVSTGISEYVNPRLRRYLRRES